MRRAKIAGCPLRVTLFLSALLALVQADGSASPATGDATLHRVKPGETLSEIAALYLGDGGLWPLLYRENRDQIKDPERLYPGQELAIPKAGGIATGLGASGRAGPGAR